VSTRRHDQFLQLEFSDDGRARKSRTGVDPFYTTKPIARDRIGIERMLRHHSEPQGENHVPRTAPKVAQFPHRTAGSTEGKRLG